VLVFLKLDNGCSSGTKWFQTEIFILFTLLKYKDGEANIFHGVGILAQDFIE
jgi:hypothetical protein